MGFRAVVTLVTSVVFVCLGYLTAGFGSMTLSLHDVAASDTVPLGIVVLYRLSCAAAALYTLVRIFFDQRGLEMRYHGAIIRLRHFRRFTTFTVWCFILLFCYFALAAYCSSALLTGHEEAVPDFVVTATLILFEISYPMSLLVTTVVSFVLLPTAIKHGYPVARMFRFRPQMMHNVNVVMMQLAMLMAPPPVAFAHLPYTALFGCSYAIFSWIWFHRTGVYYYFFLDYRQPHAVLTYLGLFTALLFFYGISYRVAGIARQETLPWWTYPCMMLITLCMTRFRPPAAVNTQPLTP
jgi:hypothetical protein